MSQETRRLEHSCSNVNGPPPYLDIAEIATKGRSVPSRLVSGSFQIPPLIYLTRRMSRGDHTGSQVWILSTFQAIQSVKEALIAHKTLDRATKIAGNPQLKHFIALTRTSSDTLLTAAIPTTVSLRSDLAVGTEHEHGLSRRTGLEGSRLEKSLVFAIRNQSPTALPLGPKHSSYGLKDIVYEWLDALSTETKHRLPCSIDELTSSSSWGYQIFHPVLLLSPSAFSSRCWTESLVLLQDYLPLLYQNVCRALNVTHIAVNAPIPRCLPTAGSSVENIVRSPLALNPLHGSFGDPDEAPGRTGFDRALWVTARQNDLDQVFAPLFTMFSKGNITEKTRVLNFPQLRNMPDGTTVVDLYAGIGYFAFSYAKAGASMVLCWEINPWSVEGLRRGAERNKFNAEIYSDGVELERFSHDLASSRSDIKLVVFHEDNKHAAARIKSLRSFIPPIRHVNCGYLPSSVASWKSALKILDPIHGGWIHAHENVAEGDIQKRAEEIEVLLSHTISADGTANPGVVSCQHVERVKTFAPGVIHCVFDLQVSPPSPYMD